MSRASRVLERAPYLGLGGVAIFVTIVSWGDGDEGMVGAGMTMILIAAVMLAAGARRRGSPKAAYLTLGLLVALFGAGGYFVTVTAEENPAMAAVSGMAMSVIVVIRVRGIVRDQARGHA